jgi:hypothetical protein
MSWIKVKDMNNKIFVIPESVFKNSYEGCGVFQRVTVEKPKSIKREVEDDTEIQLNKQTEINNTRKSSKKTSV